MGKLTNIVAASLFGLGSLVLSGCGNKELKEYNKKNKQVYGYFISFIKENKNREEGLLWVAKLENGNLELGLEKGDLLYAYLDYGSDGLEGNDKVGVMFDIVPIKNTTISGMKGAYKKDQLKAAKEYTNTLKEIMHEAKYKEY